MAGLIEAQMVAHQSIVLLSQAENEPPEGPEFGKASPIGIPVVLLLLIATVLLVWNMNKRIKNLPASFDEENPVADQLADEGTDRSGVEDVADVRKGQEDDGARPTDPADGGTGEETNGSAPGPSR